MNNAMDPNKPDASANKNTQNPMSDQSMLWGMTLEFWDVWGVRLLIGSAVAGAATVLVTFSSAYILYRVADAAQSELHTKTIGLEAIAETAKADIAKAKAEITMARERTAIVENETAKANAATEGLRKENLEMYRAISPRLLKQNREILAPLDQFAGMQAFLVSVPEWESRRFENQLGFFLRNSHWTTAPLPANEWPVQDGVEVSFIWNDTGPLVSKAAADAVVAALKNQNIDAFVRPRLKNSDSWPASVPQNALIIRVGAKPLTYFFEHEFPEIKRLREESDQRIKDAEERHRQMWGPKLK